MQPFARILYKMGYIGIILFILFLISQAFLPIEFTNSKIKQSTSTVILFGFPLFILLTLFKFPFGKQTKTGAIDKTITIVAIAVVTFMGLLFYWFGSTMCGYSQDRVLFIHKTSSQKIISRYIDCGATDSGYPEKEIHKIIPLGFLRIYQEVDTNTLNRLEWIKP